MNIISKILYQARIKGLDIVKSDDVVIKNITTKKYIKILPNGKIFTNDLLGHDKGLKDLMPKKFIIQDLYSGSSITLPMDVALHVGKDTSKGDISFAEHCLSQCFANIRNFQVVKDDNLLQQECRIEYKYALSFNERQDLIKACLEYLLN